MESSGKQLTSLIGGLQVKENEYDPNYEEKTFIESGKMDQIQTTIYEINQVSAQQHQVMIIQGQRVD